MAGDTAVWHMPRGDPPTVYLTFDDGPNPSTTPALLDVLSREGVPATFFLIDEHLTGETAPIVHRIVAEGHAIGLHSATRAHMLLSPDALEQTLTAAAQRIERAGGAPPCRAFRPHAGWRGGELYTGLKRMDYRLVGWGWMLWDFNWLRRREAPAAPVGPHRETRPRRATSSYARWRRIGTAAAAAADRRGHRAPDSGAPRPGALVRHDLSVEADCPVRVRV
jgi:peptidoglycan/xylan/chitin deacetylase (PgdA/CDA1 family)